MNIVSANKFIQEGSGIITLCGSTKFFKESMECNRLLTFKNWIVLMCGSWGHSYHKDRDNEGRDYAQVKQLHYHKILQSDAIVVVSDHTMYKGDSTNEEIAFADCRNIPVFNFDGETFSGHEMLKSIPHQLSDTSLIDDFRTTYGKLIINS
jgi:hypothetical protein